MSSRERRLLDKDIEIRKLQGELKHYKTCFFSCVFEKDRIRKDLEIATKALEEISSHYQDEMGKPTFVDWYLSAKKMCDCAEKALETIGKHNE